MRIKLLLIGLLLLVIGNLNAQNDFKIFATAVWLDRAGGSDQWFNTSYYHPENDGKDNAQHAIWKDNPQDNMFMRDLGVFKCSSGGLRMFGAEIKTFKQGSGNVCSAELNYKSYLNSAGGNSVTFSKKEVKFFRNCGGDSKFIDGAGPCFGSGYQKWQSFRNTENDFGQIDFTTNKKEGLYTLEVYYRVEGGFSSCDDKVSRYANGVNNDGSNFRASYTLCPTYSNGTKTDPTTCGGTDGTISLNYSGLVDGTDFYNGKFSHDGGVFPNGSVTVVNDVVTISGLSAGTYSNIVYTSSVNGCSPVGGGNFALSTNHLIPNAPIVGTITNPTCQVSTGSVQLSGLPTGNWIITETVTMTSLPGSGSSATFTGLTASTTYRFTVTSDRDCTSSESANAIIGPMLSIPAVPTIDAQCNGGAGMASLTFIIPNSDGFLYSLNGGAFTTNNTFTGLANGNYNVTIRNSEGCERQITSVVEPKMIIACGCPEQDTPKVLLASDSGSTCSVTPITVNGTFSGNNVQVTSISTSNGAGVLDVNSATVSPFTFTYSPDPTDIGKVVLINIQTNNPFGSPCTEGTAQYTLAVTDTQPPVVTDANQSFCVIDNPTVDDLRATGINIKWYTVATGGTPLDITDPITTGSYYASQNNGTCESYYRTEVKVTVNNTVPPTVNDPTQEFCVINNPTVADLSANGINILWYSQATGGIPLAVNTPLTNGVYYASQNDGTCESSSRTEVTVIITNSGPPSGQSAQSFCAINNPTLAQIILTGENIKWYAIQTGGAELPLSTQLINGAEYYASQTPSVGNQCESSTRFKVTVTVQSPERLRVQDNSQVFCRNVVAGKIPTVANLDAEATVPGSPIVWYDALTGGNQLNPTDELVNGSYFGSQIVNGCESIPRVEVVVSLECRVVAQDDLSENANGVDGLIDILNVLVNDNSEGDPIDLNVFVLSLTNPLDPSNPLTLDLTDGTVDLAPNTPAGEYTLGYTITQIGTPTNTDSAIITVRVNARPDLLISKTVSNSADNGCGLGYYVGSNVTFTLTVQNTGLDTATEVSVVDNLPNGYSYVPGSANTNGNGTFDGTTWMIGSLGAGSTINMTFDALILWSGNYTNSAKVSAKETDSDFNNNTSTVSINPIIPVADLKLEYLVDNSEPFVGDLVTFTIRAINDGPSNATGVVVESLLPKGYFFFSANSTSGIYNSSTGFWPIGNLINGGSETLTIRAGVLAKSTNDTDAIYNVSGTINGVECDPTPGVVVQPPITPKPTANLVVSINVNDSKPYVGNQVIFETFVENLGPSIATDVELTLTLPEGHTYVSHTFKDNVLDPSMFDPSTGKWMVGTMDGKGDVIKSATLLVTTTTNPKKISYTTVAETWCNEEQPFGHPNHNPSSDITNNRDQVTTSPVKRVDLKMDKQIDNIAPSVGEQVTFKLIATNPVDLSDATGVVVVDPIPSGYTYISDTSGGAYDPLTGIWTIGNLVSNTGSVSIDIVASVNVTGSYTNTATVTSVEDEKESTDNIASVTPIVAPNSDLSVQVSVSSSVVKLYDQITYTITVTNNGLSDATGVLMTDVLPTEFSYLSDDSGGVYDPTSGAFSIGNLIVNATSTIKITGIINGVSNANKEEKIVNSVSVAGAQADKDLTNNTAQIEITYVPDCEIRVYNFVSANGDGKNDYFRIDNIECYDYSKVKIFNRWGSMVYEEDYYQSTDNGNGKVFKGISNNGVGSKELPEGTYFYILTYNSGSNKLEQTGYIQLTR